MPIHNKLFLIILNCGVLPTDSLKTKISKQVLTLLPIIIGIAAAIWGSIYGYLGRPLSASIPLSYSIISFFSLLYFAYTKNVRFLQTSQLVLVLILPFLLMWSLGGFKAGSYVMIWAFYAPLAALSFSKKSGFFWLFLFLVMTLVSALIDQTLENEIVPMGKHAITIFSWLNITAGFGGIFYIMFHYINERDAAASDLEILNIELASKIEAAIAENDKTNQILMHQSKLASMGEMISMIAHQWRQPLNTISASAGALNLKILLDKYDQKTFSENIQKIISLTQHLSSTIDDFRNFFKPNKLKNSFTLRHAIESAIALNESSFNNQNITLIRNFETEGEISGYENELIQVFLNLLKNSLDALNEKKIVKPKIIITIEQKDHDKLLVSIEDNAGGIAKEIADKIYQPYFSTKSQNGTGLGLYMSKIIIEDHCHGRLVFHNTAEGACFTILLDSEKKE